MRIKWTTIGHETSDERDVVNKVVVHKPIIRMEAVTFAHYRFQFGGTALALDRATVFQAVKKLEETCQGHNWLTRGKANVRYVSELTTLTIILHIERN